MTTGQAAFERSIDRYAAGNSEEYTREDWCSNGDCPKFEQEQTITGLLTDTGHWEWECPTCGDTYTSDLNCDTCRHAPCACPD